MKTEQSGLGYTDFFLMSATGVMTMIALAVFSFWFGRFIAKRIKQRQLVGNPDYKAPIFVRALPLVIFFLLYPLVTNFITHVIQTW